MCIIIVIVIFILTDIIIISFIIIKLNIIICYPVYQNYSHSYQDYYLLILSCNSEFFILNYSFVFVF